MYVVGWVQHGQSFDSDWDPIKYFLEDINFSNFSKNINTTGMLDVSEKPE